MLPAPFLVQRRQCRPYLVSTGREIFVEPEPHAEIDALKLFLFGSGVGRFALPARCSPARQRSCNSAWGRYFYRLFRNRKVSACLCPEPSRVSGPH